LQRITLGVGVKAVLSVDGQALTNKAVAGVIWVGSTKLLGQTISWAITLLVVRILSPDDYGLMGMALAFLGAIQLVNEMGLGAAIVQKQALDQDALSTVFWFSLAVSCALYGLAALCAPLVAAFFQNGRVTVLIRILGFNLLLGALRAVPFYLLIKEMAFDKKAKAELISNLLGGLTAVSLAYLGFGVWSLVLSAIALNVALTSLVTYYHPWRPHGVFRPGRIWGLLRFGMQVLGSRLLAFGYGGADVLVVGKVLGERVLGFYAIATDLAGKGVDLLSEILAQVTFPVYASLQNDRAALQRYYLKLTTLVAMTVFPAFGGLILIAPDMFTVLLTEKWLPAASIFQVLCAVAAIRSLAVLGPPLLTAIGRADLNLRYTFLCASTMPPAFIIGSLFGLRGIACAWLVVYPGLFFCGLLRVLLRVLNLSLREYLSRLLPALAGTMLMAALVLAFQNVLPSGPPLTRLAGSCIVGAVGYLLFIHLAFQGLHELAFLIPYTRRILQLKGLT
jgi:O-antigen/teichoic acid export membrane protein